jgi:hypothetical protein
MEHPEFRAPGIVLGAKIELARGNAKGALALVEEYRRSTEDHLTYRAQLLPDALRTTLAAGDQALATSLVPKDFEGKTNRYRFALATADAMLAEARGDFEGAADRYRDVVAKWRSYGSMHELGEELLGLARCLSALGERDEADAAASEARSIAEGASAPRMMAEAERLLGASATTRTS